MGSESDFAKTVEQNFSAFDGDGNNQVSRFELEKAEANERLSEEARQAAHTLLANFDQARNMAGRDPRNLDPASYGQRDYNTIFVDGDFNSITKKDVAVMKLASSDPAEIDALIQKQESNRTFEGVGRVVGGTVMLAPGLVCDAIGVATFGTPGTLFLVPGAVLTLGGGAMIYEGYRELTQPTSQLIRDRLTESHQTMQSWSITK